MAEIEVKVLKQNQCDGSLVAGLDEAGRGSLVGELFVALTIFSEHELEELKRAGVRDSKMLEPLEREAFFDKILERACYVAVALIPPILIDEENLNKLEYKAMTRLLKHAYKHNIKPSRITIDLVGRSSRLKLFLARAGIKGKIIVEERADAKYPEVSAASIVAKVLRDRRIGELSEHYGDMGSGYPSDPRTLEWLKEIYSNEGKVPDIVRRSWETMDKLGSGLRIKKRKGQRNLLEYMDE